MFTTCRGPWADPQLLRVWAPILSLQPTLSRRTHVHSWELCGRGVPSPQLCRGRSRALQSGAGREQL